MNEYKGIPYARMHAHGYARIGRIATPRIQVDHV